jgi:hypothetical protein
MLYVDLDARQDFVNSVEIKLFSQHVELCRYTLPEDLGAHDGRSLKLDGSVSSAEYAPAIWMFIFKASKFCPSFASVKNGD